MKRRMQGVMFRMPMMITCRQFEEFIIDYLDGELTNHEARLFEIHLRICRECREYLAAYEATMEAARLGLDESVAPLPDEVPEDLIAAVIESRDARK
jgi:anti-sigma factor RsiW